MTVSEAYADLGGGVASAATNPSPANRHRHRFDQTSGYCGCGRRDDGALAPGSPAWRADRQALRT